MLLNQVRIKMTKSWLQLFFFCIAFCYLSIVSFVSYPITTIIKPIPICILILMVWNQHISPFERWLLVLALMCSIGGDIALTLPVTKALDGGIVFFLFAHFAYIGFFSQYVKLALARVCFFLPVILLVGFFFYSLMPVMGQYKIPLMVYFCILSFMVGSTFFIKTFSIRLVLGALCFLVSDLLIIFNVFLLKYEYMQLLTMSTYYLAQYWLITGAMQLSKGGRDVWHTSKCYVSGLRS